MRCTYESDVIKKESLHVPTWLNKIPSASIKGKDSENPRWHHQFMPRPRRNARSTYIKSVSVVVSLMPGILDIDVLCALAHCQQEHLQIMNQKTVQAGVLCLWNNLVEKVWAVEVVFRFCDVSAYVALSLLVHTGDHLTSLCWPVVASGNIYSLLTLFLHLFSLLRKWNEHVDEESMHDMWSPFSKWNLGYIIPFFVQTLICSVLVLDVQWKHSFDGKRDNFDDALLALALLISCFRFIWMWRLSVIGSRIYTICQTFLAGAVNQMLFITFMLLCSFIAALQVLSRMHSWRLALDSYRGFLFGDGDGFNGLGMDIDYDHSFSPMGSEGSGPSTALIGFSVLGSFFFNVIVINIMIAIYGNEYDKMESDTPCLFMKGRADCCVKTILAYYVIAWRSESFNYMMTVLAVSMLCAGLCVAKFTDGFAYMWLSAVLLACGQILLPMAMVQCDWFSPEGQDSNDQKRYLWICHPPDWQWTSSDESAVDIADSLSANHEAMEQRVSHLDEKISQLDEKIELLLMMGKQNRAA